MLNIRIITRDNGVGLSRDMALVKEALSGAGHRVECVGYGGSQLVNRMRELNLWRHSALHGKVDLQIFLERVYRRCLPFARRNYLIPNPEWFLSKWTSDLKRFDRVLCKTQHAKNIFDVLGCHTVLTGFTSADVFDSQIQKTGAFFHLAGRSSAKGTEAVLAAWRQHPEWPHLTVVQHPKMAVAGPQAANITHCIDYLDAKSLQLLQNSHRFHLCPSEIEGFGHYLMEGMAVGSVVLTTDAAPMNELVTLQRGLLIRASRHKQEGLVEHALVDVAGIEAGVLEALSLSDADCVRLGQAARQFYLDNDRCFSERLVAACVDD